MTNIKKFKQTNKIIENLLLIIKDPEVKNLFIIKTNNIGLKRRFKVKWVRAFKSRAV